jgi:ribosomal protein L18E
MASTGSKGIRIMNTKTVKEYAILWMHSQNKTTQEIAESLELPKAYVTKTINVHKTQTETSENDVITGVTKTSKDFMINKTFGKNASGVTIMTKEASEHNDSSRSKRVSQEQAGHDCIFRPNN